LIKFSLFLDKNSLICISKFPVPLRWQEFRSRYAAEVYEHPEQLKRLRALARQGPITLVFSAHDEVHNDAVALRDFLLGRQKTKRKPSATM
jgi:Inactive DUF488-N3 subclade